MAEGACVRTRTRTHARAIRGPLAARSSLCVASSPSRLPAVKKHDTYGGVVNHLLFLHPAGVRLLDKLQHKLLLLLKLMLPLLLLLLVLLKLMLPLQLQLLQLLLLILKQKLLQQYRLKMML